MQWESGNATGHRKLLALDDEASIGWSFLPMHAYAVPDHAHCIRASALGQRFLDVSMSAPNPHGW